MIRPRPPSRSIAKMAPAVGVIHPAGQALQVGLRVVSGSGRDHGLKSLSELAQVVDPARQFGPGAGAETFGEPTGPLGHAFKVVRQFMTDPSFFADPGLTCASQPVFSIAPSYERLLLILPRFGGHRKKHPYSGVGQS